MILRNTRFSHEAITEPKFVSNNLISFEQGETIKLNELRHKRKQVESKLKMVSNRIGYRKKKEEDQLRKILKTQERVRAMSQTQHFKKFNQLLKQQLVQRNQFESKKKARQVQDSRLTNNKRLSFIYQAIKDRKNVQSDKLRKAKKLDEEIIQFTKQQARSTRKQKHDHIQRLRQRQHIKKKCYWLQKKMSYQQKLAEEAEIYEKQIQQYYKKIDRLKNVENDLKVQEAQAQQALRSAQQNYELLKQS